MNGVGFIGAIVIGLLAGWLAERFMGRSHGLITNLIVGLVGAVLGGFVAGLAGFGYAGFLPSLIVSTLGAVLLLVLLNMVARRG
ncbi:MAG: GlsB/YeaQ/YmgE family stress response membrane protein [Roseococcus sp.]|nr:GlsB/YeaQ/YmgE family stress response membrane protein [Roseococcus sp.]